MTKIDDFLRSEIDLGSFAGCAYAVGSYDGIERENALGHAVVVPERIPATLDTIWDGASITKPLVTTTLVMQAVADGKIDLDGSFKGFPFRDLLTHTSGLAAWLPLYALRGDSEFGIRDSEIHAASPESRTPDPDYLTPILQKGPEYPPHTKVVYSDLNFVLLWYALREQCGDYVSLAEERIFRRLGLADAMFRPDPSLRPRIAATEWGNWHERKMCAERKIVFDGFRDGMIWGETHDGNSHHAGGTAGNAGLFATARAVYRIAQGWLDGTLVPRELFEEATNNFTRGLEEHRGLGWQMSYPGHAATGMLSSRAFGHTGFTGTSVWIEPDAKRIMVLMANRVHPCAAPIAMQKIRGAFHGLALA